MKGQSREFMFIIMVILGIFFSLLYINLIFIEGRVGRLKITLNTYTMRNALLSSYLYLSQSLRYSIYQSCYENLKNGGQDILKMYETINNTSYPYIINKSKFLKQLENKTLQKLNLYTTEKYNFLNVEILLPKYKNVSIKPYNNSLYVSAISDNYITLMKSEENLTITFEKSSKLNETIKTACFTIFKKGINLKEWLESEISKIIKNELKQFPKNGFLASEKKPSDFDVFKSAIKLAGLNLVGTKKDIERVLGRNIYNSINKFLKSVKDDNLDINKRLLFTDADIILKCSKDININEKGLYVKECNFYYLLTALIYIEIIDKTHNYPVFNGKEITLEPLQLRYIVKVYEIYPTEPFKP